MTRPYIIPIFIPHLGCPHQCIYCNQRTITGVTSSINLEEIKKNIDFFLLRQRHPKRGQIQIAFYGGSFTALKPKLRRNLLSLGFHYVQTGQVDALRLSTRPDAIDESVLEELKKYGVSTIELGVQSLDDTVLSLAHRGHTAEATYKTSELIKKTGFSLGWQLMPGLPGETETSRQKTVNEVVKWRPDFVRIYPTLVIKGTPLAQLWKEGKYTALSLTEAVGICKKMVLTFTEAGIPVIRVGLQASDSLLEPGHILAGPWHPAFGELVKSAIWLDVLEKIVKKHFSNSMDIKIFAHPTMLSQLVGQKKANYEELKHIFPEKRIAFSVDLRLKKGEIKVITHGKEKILTGLRGF
ncbi:MAG: radical SAM protein [Candidatus Desulfofervidaceae bacterium]|nr:radical SAM protein [Candidatus Desulfofervidaceae bacterium]